MNRTMFTLLALGSLSTAAIGAVQAQVATTTALAPVKRQAPIALVTRGDGTCVAQTIVVACCDPKACDPRPGQTTVSVFVTTNGAGSSASASGAPVVIERSGSVSAGQPSCVGGRGTLSTAVSGCASGAFAPSVGMGTGACTGTGVQLGAASVQLGAAAVSTLPTVASGIFAAQSPIWPKVAQQRHAEIQRAQDPDGETEDMEIEGLDDDESGEAFAQSPEFEVFDASDSEVAFDMSDLDMMDANQSFEELNDVEDSDAQELREQRLAEVRESIESAKNDMREAQGNAREAYREAMTQQRGALEQQRGALEQHRGALEQQRAALEQQRGSVDQQRAAIERAREAVHSRTDATRARTRAGSTMRLYATAPDSPSRMQLFDSGTTAPATGGGLAERIEALERIALERGYQSQNDSGHVDGSLEDRVAELERFMNGSHPSRRSDSNSASPNSASPNSAQSNHTSQNHTWTWSVPPTPAAPRAAAPVRPYVLRVTPGIQSRITHPDTQPRAPSAASAPLRLRAAAVAPETPMAGSAPSIESTPGAALPVEPEATTPAPSAERRVEIERAMSDLRAQADALRAEMAKMRARINELPRNER